ncbi:ATP synthase subunit gamma, mitochondrial-like isoform X2 [Agrilus planipennis]|uniref:ATP synthase subunit gamma, mitochondrial-like isoform X2 n=1 Tax=Agrilus planipennis TaxID=224129 RepID=A0A7F5RI04_AGRPL|nr:ATP synthase subunit gamma, mitochondrial-like isoform X2 [Agrilus planipennis]
MCFLTMSRFSKWLNTYQVKHNVPFRSMATLRELKDRLTSVGNIGKIAKSMKMVATVKFARAEREAKEAAVLEGSVAGFIVV